MGFCDKFKVDRVICDEIFYVEDDEIDVPIGEIVVPDESEIGGTVTVTVLDATPFIIDPTDDDPGTLGANLVFMIQKELTIDTDPDDDNAPVIPLEFGFRLEREVIYRKCTPAQLLEIDSALLENLRCEIISINGTDEVAITPSSTPQTKDASFDEFLTIQVKIKLVQEKQMALSLCPGTQQIDIPVEEVQPV